MTCAARAAGCALTLWALAGCTVSETPTPPLTGPSTFATSLALDVTPATVVGNGTDRAVITVKARGADGRPIQVPLVADIEVDGARVDFGALTPRTTRSDSAGGEAAFTFVTPTWRAGMPDEVLVTIIVRVNEGSQDGAVPRRASVRVVAPPELRSQPALTFATAFSQVPAPALAQEPVTFDAISTARGVAACRADCQYLWDFGDGSRAIGATVSHVYAEPGIYAVTVTIADDLGRSGQMSQPVRVVSVTEPTAVFRVSPTPVSAGQDVHFSGVESRAPAGRRVIGYTWDFGDGTSGEGVTTTHRYSRSGTYVVILGVTDSARAVAYTTQTLTVTSGQPVVTVAATKASGRRVTVNVTATPAAGATISTYRVEWGDGVVDSGPASTQTHGYASDGTYVIVVTVTDSAGRSTTVTQQVIIP